MSRFPRCWRPVLKFWSCLFNRLGRNNRRLGWCVHRRNGRSVKGNDHSAPIARNLIRRRRRQINHYARHVRPVLAKAHRAHRGSQPWDNRLVNGQPGTREIQHQAIRAVHASRAHIETSFALHPYRRAFRRLSDGNAGDNRGGFPCTGGFLCLRQHRTDRQCRAREDQAAMSKGRPIRLHCCSPELVE